MGWPKFISDPPKFVGCQHTVSLVTDLEIKQVRSNRSFMMCVVVFLFTVILLGPFPMTTYADTDIPHIEVSNWAIRFGSQMWQIGKQTTRVRDIREKYQKDAKIERVDGITMIREMAEEVGYTMKDKIEAVKRIMDAAEEAGMSELQQDEEDRKKQAQRVYSVKRHNGYNLFIETEEDTKIVKKELPMIKSRQFDNMEVSFNISAVHVPTNVYDGAPNVVNATIWSDHLNRIFISNYESDPYLSWQYFGSSTGMMRQYPAIKWNLKDSDPDLFDCRLRPWYLQAAASPKDLFILFDSSGSMTGVRREIAKQVIMTLLDTLSENDFVNVYRFNDTPKPLVPCFTGKLVQANLENIRELKMNMDNFETFDIANFTSALITAFDILSLYNKTVRGSQCNQAIMLVTDGAPSDFKEVFEKYNEPHKPVRLFTYLIGREITDTTSTKEMACSNKGYFVHVTSLAEVREQVLKYIPVLSRPMVMYQKQHPLIWTPVYADIVDPKMSEWLWEVHERRRQRDRSINYRHLIQLTSGKPNPSDEITSHTNHTNPQNASIDVEKFLTYGKSFVTDQDIATYWAVKNRERIENTAKSQMKYRMMTSVATPVYDRKNYTVRTANLLGVAGTDVPISEFKKRIEPWKLGVNGYSFMINNNGYILYHPDFRPVLETIVSPKDSSQYEDILKPNYNTVDLSEVELVDSDTDQKENDTLFMMRREMLDRKEGETIMKIRHHYDSMKRASVRTQRYYYRPLEETPFSLGIALPDGYGRFRVVAETEIKRVITDHNVNVSSYFSGKNWKVHPEWVYCRYHYDQEKSFKTPEEEFLHFLERTRQPGWKWHNNYPHPSRDALKFAGSRKPDADAYYCDKRLFQSLVFDAAATVDFDKNISFKYNPEDEHSVFKMFGISVLFIATRSGLTRWLDNEMNDASSYDPFYSGHFSESNVFSIDQTWYKRAVDQHEVEPESFVYSVPFDAGIRNESIVTASHAIFVDKDGYKAPAVVVGLQFKNSIFRETFFNITSICTGEIPCKKTCRSGDLACYVLDNNGYVVISKEHEHTGKFFGEIDGTIMDSLVFYDVYKKIRIYDNQAVCQDVVGPKSSANFLLTPLRYIKWAVHWMIGRVSWLLLRSQLAHIINPDWAWSLEQESQNYDEDLADPSAKVEEGGKISVGVEVEDAYVNRTRPQPCRKQVDLYSLQPDRLYENGKERAVKGRLANCNSNIFARSCGRNFSIHKIRFSNLVLLVLDTTCKCETRKLTVDPVEVKNNDSQTCDRLHDNLYRVRPGVCINYHPEEEEIKLCGGGNSVCLSYKTYLSIMLVVLLNNFLQVYV